MAKEDVVYIYNGILLSHKKIFFAVCSNMDWLEGHSAKWNKSDRERQILHAAAAAAAAAKSFQSCPTLCDPIDGSLPGSPVPGILQARTLELVAISFSNAWKWKVKVKSLSHVWLLGTPWTAAYQAPVSMGFSRQEYWSGVPLPSPKYCYHLYVESKKYNKLLNVTEKKKRRSRLTDKYKLVVTTGEQEEGRGITWVED